MNRAPSSELIKEKNQYFLILAIVTWWMLIYKNYSSKTFPKSFTCGPLYLASTSYGYYYYYYYYFMHFHVHTKYPGFILEDWMVTSFPNIPALASNCFLVVLSYDLIFLQIFSSSNLCARLFRTIINAPTTMGTTVTFIFHNFFSILDSCLNFHFLSTLFYNLLEQ